MVRHPGPQQQRGAAALFAAIGLLGMLIAAAFAIDLAQMYVAKRQLQNMANLAALDVARAAGGCLAPTEDRQGMANLTAFATINRLGGEAEWLRNDAVRLGRAQIAADGQRAFQPTVVEENGQAFAFEVELQRPVPRLILPMPGQTTDDAVMRVRAASVMAPRASFGVSSYGVAIDPTERSILNNVLGDALGAPLELSLLSAQGLLASSVDLLNVADEFAGVTLEELLTGPVQLPGLLTSIANALFAAGHGTAAAAVDAIAAVAPNEEVFVGDVVTSPDDLVYSVGDVALNSLDLVQALVQQVGDPVLQLTPGLTLPPLIELDGIITLGQPPALAAGPAVQDSSSSFVTQARNAQGRADLDLGFNLVGLGDVNLAIGLDVAEATADLRQIRCAGRGRDNHEVDIGVNTTIARLDINNTVDNPLINVLGLIKVCWEGSIEVGEDAYEIVPFEGPFDPDNPTTKPVGSSIGASLSQALSDLAINSPPELCGSLGGLNGLLFLLGLGNDQALLGQVVGGVLPIVTDALDGLLLDPVLAALGLSVGGAHISVNEVKMAPPALIQTR